MNEQEIKIAIEVSKELYAIRSKDCGNIPPYALSEEAKALCILVALAQQYLDCKGMPEELQPHCDDGWDKLYQKLIDCNAVFKLAHIKGGER